MEEYRFDAEAINELLSWAEQVLKDDSLPKGEYQLSVASFTNWPCLQFM